MQFSQQSSSSCSCRKLKHFYVCRKLFGKTKSAKNIFTRDKQSDEDEEGERVRRANRAEVNPAKYHESCRK